ncbi:hypothetical protein TcCL_Unassigned02096 [Trypanosoma cruzi]|nr:hypothetical protein TcCL_Unassigned02096 [Trypanosoma cruzi]
MAASQGGPDAVHDTQEPRQTTWQRYDRQPSSASERSLLVLVVRKWSGELAGRQQPKLRFLFMRFGIAQQAAAPDVHGPHNKVKIKKHGGGNQTRGKGSTSILHSNWLTDIRMVVAPLLCGACGV